MIEVYNSWVQIPHEKRSGHSAGPLKMWDGAGHFVSQECLKKKNRQVHLKEAVQGHKACPNIYSDSDRPVLKKFLSAVSVNILVASRASDSARDPFSLHRMHQVEMLSTKNLKNGTKCVSYCFLNAGFQ